MAVGNATRFAHTHAMAFILKSTNVDMSKVKYVASYIIWQGCDDRLVQIFSELWYKK